MLCNTISAGAPEISKSHRPRNSLYWRKLILKQIVKTWWQYIFKDRTRLYRSKQEKRRTLDYVLTIMEFIFNGHCLGSVGKEVGFISLMFFLFWEKSFDAASPGWVCVVVWIVCPPKYVQVLTFGTWEYDLIGKHYPNRCNQVGLNSRTGVFLRIRKYGKRCRQREHLVMI